jgi:hypothetical protein
MPDKREEKPARSVMVVINDDTGKVLAIYGIPYEEEVCWVSYQSLRQHLQSIPDIVLCELPLIQPVTLNSFHQFMVTITCPSEWPYTTDDHILAKPVFLPSLKEARIEFFDDPIKQMQAVFWAENIDAARERAVKVLLEVWNTPVPMNANVMNQKAEEWKGYKS